MKLRLKSAAFLSGLVAALGWATVAFAGKQPPPPPPPYNPQILYIVGSQGGRTITFYVANADGTDAVAVYSTGNIIWNLKSAPGHQIVFVEQNSIKLLTYAVSPQGVATTSVITLTSQPYHVLHVDVSPDSTELLFVEDTANPNESTVYVMSMSGGTPIALNLPSSVYSDAVWAHSNSRIAVIQGAAVEQGSGTQTFQVMDWDPINNNSSPTTVFTSTQSQLYQIGQFESAHTSDTLIFGAVSGSNGGVYTLDITTPTMPLLSGPLVAGSSPSFSSDDSTILFIGAPDNFFELNVTTETQTPVSAPKLAARPYFLLP